MGVRQSSRARRLVLDLSLWAVRLLGTLLPRAERRDWVEEWQGELIARYAGPMERHGVLRTPIAPLTDVRGALADVFWHLKQEWNHDMLSHDVRAAVRSLTHRPGFTAAVALTLGLGIAANAVIFSAVDAVVFNPFDFPDPGRVVGIGAEYPRLDSGLRFFEAISAPEYADIVAQSEALEQIVAFDLGNRQITGGDIPQNLFSGFWWGDVLPTLGVEPALGRGFTRADIDTRQAVAMISHRIWVSRFGGDESVVGSTIRVDGDPYTLIGVFPPEALIYGTDLWLPMWADPELLPRDRRQFNIIARVAAGHSLQQVNAELEAVARRAEQAYGDEFDEYEDWRLLAWTWTDVNVSTLQPAAAILLGSVGFVLLLVCSNVASLLLSRAAGRRRDIAVRAALGAGRVRLVRQLLTESVLLAVIGGAVGVGLAFGGLDLLITQAPDNLIPTTADIEINYRVLGYVAVVSVLCGVVFGLAPALQTARADLQRILNSETDRASGGKGRRRLHGAFVVTEVALATVLLVGAGLLVRSLARIQAVDPGFATDDVLTMRLTLPWNKYEGEAITNFFEDLVARVEAIPGVASAAAGSQFPPIVFINRQIAFVGQEASDEGTLPSAFMTFADDQYFDTLGIPLRGGRVFDRRDVAGAPYVAVVNEEFVRRYRGGASPLGQRFRLGADPEEGEWVEVVGVVGSTRNRGLQSDSQPEFFLSLRQVDGAFNQIFLLIRTAGEPTAVLPQVREAVAAIDPEQPIYSIRTVDETYAGGFAQQQFAMYMLVAFAVLSLVLAAVGIYGVVAQGVSERTREIGVRLALGAGGPEVSSLMVRQALVPVAIGLVVGLALAVALGTAMSSLLYEIGGVDLPTLAVVVLVLSSAALAAGYLPARRASRVDPVVALRFE